MVGVHRGMCVNHLYHDVVFFECSIQFNVIVVVICPVNPMSMLPKLELMCGDRGPFLAAVAMVVMWLFSSKTAVKIGVRESKPPNVMLNPPYVKGLKFSPILHRGWSRSGLKNPILWGSKF